MSAVSDILFVVAVLREHGITVTFESNWETRGNGQQTDGYDGSLIHHTAIPASYTNPGPGTRVLRDGRPDLQGPLCQGQVKFTGAVHVIAAQPANHAGASGGPSMGPLPVTRLFNPRVMGWEVDYAGNSPMSPEQYRTCLVIAVATQRLRGRPSLEWTRAHAETSIEGKWDPGWAPGRTIDMGAFRADAANLQEDELSAEAERRIKELHDSTGRVFTATNKDWSDVLIALDRTNDMVLNLYLAAFYGGESTPGKRPWQDIWAEAAGKDGADVDEEKLASFVVPALLAGAQKLSDEQWAQLVQDVNNERDRRERARLEAQV